VRESKKVTDALLRKFCKFVKPIVDSEPAPAADDVTADAEATETAEADKKKAEKEEISKIKSLLHDAALRKFGTAKRLEDLKSDKGPKRRDRPPNQMHNQGKGDWNNKNKHNPNGGGGNGWLQPEDPLAKEIRNKAK
jgi:hypothetical protein